MSTAADHHGLDVFYSEDYVESECGFDTMRKSRPIADALRDGLVDGARLVAPEPARRDELVGIHDDVLVDAVLSGEPGHLAASAGLGWDPGLATAVLASTGGCRDAARSAWRHGVAGSLSSGLHHARRSSGAGFCTFNGVALAVLGFLDLGARSVLVLDLDAHCGGGTVDILGGDGRVVHLDVATDPFDGYEPTAPSTLGLIDDADDYLPTIVARLDAIDEGSVDAVVFNAGMDPHEDCGIGGLPGITDDILAEREATVFSWAAAARLPIAFVLAGGYSSGAMGSDHLTDLHLLTVAAAARSAVERRRQGGA